LETPGVFSFLKPEKDLVLPSSYRPISVLDTIGKLFESNTLARILCEEERFGLLRNEQFGFRHKHSTMLLPTCLVERMSRKFDEKKLTGPVFLDVDKAFDTVWFDGLPYKITVLNFPSFLVKIISSYLNSRTFEACYQTATFTCIHMRAGVA
jgi:hypothetical protein